MDKRQHTGYRLLELVIGYLNPRDAFSQQVGASRGFDYL